MNIGALLNSTLSNGLGANASAASTDASGASAVVAKALSRVNQRLQTDQSAATAQLSSFALLKSAVAGSQDAAQAMTKLTSASASTDVTHAMADFFNQFNGTMKAAATTAALPGSDAAVRSAQRVSRDMQWALNSNSAVIDAMKTVGLTLQGDGTLKQDAAKFGAALSSKPASVLQAMATIGKAIDTVATKDLGSTGAVGATMASLSQYRNALTAQQQALAKLGLNTSAATASTATTTASAGYGLAAYQSQSAGK